VTLARLATDGPRIEGVAGGFLRGVNRSGLEYTTPYLRVSSDEMDTICRRWNANIVRFPLNQKWLLEDTAAYLDAIDANVALAADRGAYSLLTLQWLWPPPRANIINIQPLPDEDSLKFWTILAARYGQAPHVLFDLYTEPHDCAFTEWRAWARRLIDVIRAQSRDSLIFVSGTNWGRDVSQMEFPDEENLVYSVHWYPHHSIDLDVELQSWSDSIEALRQRAPVFAAEWGPHEDFDSPARDLVKELAYCNRLAAYLRALGVGWTAWSWIDRPRLTVDEQATPSAWGAIVQRELLTPY
jgi:hypothetical protein